MNTTNRPAATIIRNLMTAALLLIWIPADLPAAEGGAVTGPSVAPVATASGLDKADIAFIRESYQRGLYMLRASEAALNRPVVGTELDFAKQMVADQGALNRDLVTLAAQKAVTLPASLDSSAQEAYDAQTRSIDAQVAETYLTGQVKAHQAAISAFKDIATDSKDGDVQAFVSRHLTQLQARLDTAKRLADAH